MVQGRLALVTGGGGGIGQATCQVLARDGAMVVAADFNIKAAEETVKILTGTGHVAIFVDVSKEDSIKELFGAIFTQFKAPPSIIVNCAGILLFTPLLEETEDTYHRQFNINVKGTLRVTQIACKELQKANLHGSIINISSICSNGFPCMVSYGATKAAVESLSKSVGREMAGSGIRCNVVAPGPIDTSLLNSFSEEHKVYTLNQLLPLKRFGQPMEVAETIAFLASEKSSYINATVIKIDGGM